MIYIIYIIEAILFLYGMCKIADAILEDDFYCFYDAIIPFALLFFIHINI